MWAGLEGVCEREDQGRSSRERQGHRGSKLPEIELDTKRCRLTTGI